MTQPTIGRPYSPTDLDHSLIPLLGRYMPFVDGDEVRIGLLGNIHADGTVTMVNDSDIVMAVLPASCLGAEPSVIRTEADGADTVFVADNCPRCDASAWGGETLEALAENLNHGCAR